MDRLKPLCASGSITDGLNLHSNMDRLKLGRLDLYNLCGTDLHSNMDRLKPFAPVSAKYEETYLHSNMDRLKRGGWFYTWH